MTALDPRTTDRLDQLLTSQQRACRLPSVVAAVTDGSAVLWSGAVGHLDGRAGGPPATVDTQYRIGSITKTFTAVLVMQQRDAGRLALQDRLGDHVTGTGYDRVTVAELLSHRAGLPAETAGPWWERVAGVPWQELLAQVGPNVFAPGQRHHYSNLGFAVLGQLLTELTGRSWAELLRDEVLTPLGMTRTSCRPQPPAAPGWAVHPEADLMQPEPEHDAAAMAPAGQLWSTVADLARWAGFLAGDTAGVLAPATLDEMLAPQAVVDSPGRPWVEASGLGWQLQNVDGDRVAGHGGSMPGFLAQLWVQRDTGRGGVTLTNSTSGPMPDLAPMFAEVSAALPVPVEPWTAQPPTAEQRELLGTWYWGPRAQVMRAVGDRLVLGVPGDWRPAEFGRDESGRWIGRTGYCAGEELRAIRGPDGRVSHLDIASFRWTRTPYDPAGDIPGGVLDDWR